MSDRTLEYQPSPRPKRTRWWLIVLLVGLTPLVLFVIVFLLTLAGCFGGPGD